MDFQGFLENYWMLLLPPLVGFAAIYALLPQGRRVPAALGVALGGAALAGIGYYVVHASGHWVEQVLFYLFSGLALVGAGLMLAQHNPVYSALSFALVVLAVCGLFLLNAAPFLMAATIIVYAGAIVVTFLFVIMLAQQGGQSAADARTREPFLACVAGFVLVGAILCVLHRSYNTRQIEELLGQVQSVAQANTLTEVNNLLGDPKVKAQEKGKVALPLVESLRKYFPSDADVFDNLASAWAKPNQDLKQIKNAAALAWNRGKELRLAHGSLFPPRELPVSHLSGAPASVPPALSPDGKLRERLPAENVASLGRSLFTDYLVPVQLAAVVLLVATIGAIAIAGRRSEGLR